MLTTESTHSHFSRSTENQNVNSYEELENKILCQNMWCGTHKWNIYNHRETKPLKM